jgi:hypothetical protein
MKMIVFYDVIPCSMQTGTNVPPICCLYLSTKRYGFTSQKTIIFVCPLSQYEGVPHEQLLMPSNENNSNGSEQGPVVTSVDMVMNILVPSNWGISLPYK